MIQFIQTVMEMMKVGVSIVFGLLFLRQLTSAQPLTPLKSPPNVPVLWTIASSDTNSQMQWTCSRAQVQWTLYNSMEQSQQQQMKWTWNQSTTIVHYTSIPSPGSNQSQTQFMANTQLSAPSAHVSVSKVPITVSNQLQSFTLIVRTLIQSSVVIFIFSCSTARPV